MFVAHESQPRKRCWPEARLCLRHAQALVGCVAGVCGVRTILAEASFSNLVQVGACVAIESQALAPSGCRCEGARRLGASQCMAPITPCQPSTNRALGSGCWKPQDRCPKVTRAHFRFGADFLDTSCPCSRTLQMVDDGESGRTVFGAGDFIGHHVCMCGGRRMASGNLGGMSADVVGGPSWMGDVGLDLSDRFEVWRF